ncbi:MAG: type II toxin-antitoxin system RelE/ParE family toxin [Bdellovibrionales bacterium]
MLKKDVPALPKCMRARIKKAIEERLMIDPVSYGKPLQHSLKGHRRLRVGDYRIIYTIDPEKRNVSVLAIGHRKDIYE